MNTSRPNRWINSACLGRVPASVDDSARRIVEVFSDLAQWVYDWISPLEHNVSFLDSSTAACNAALITLLPDCECILHTSSVHPAIRLSIKTMAQLSGRFRGRTPVVGEIDLRGIPLSSSDEFSHHICDRIVRLTENRPTVLVLEHITYNHGVRLPITNICAQLSATHPEIRVIIDGAQATGLWRPVDARPTAYFGCFHKVVGSPPGAAFLSIEKTFSGFLPSHVEMLSNLSDTITNDALQTVDLPKWEQTARIVKKRFAVDNIEHHISRINRFNQKLDDALAPYTISLGRSYDFQFRSHISSIEFATEESAEQAFRMLSETGYLTKRFGSLLRLSVGPNIKSRYATEVGVLLRKELKKALFLIDGSNLH